MRLRLPHPVSNQSGQRFSDALHLVPEGGFRVGPERQVVLISPDGAGRVPQPRREAPLLSEHRGKIRLPAQVVGAAAKRPQGAVAVPAEMSAARTTSLGRPSMPRSSSQPEA